MVGFLLADIHSLRRGRREVQQRVVRQMIEEHRIRKTKNPPAFQSDELRIARACSDQVDLARAAHP